MLCRSSSDAFVMLNPSSAHTEPQQPSSIGSCERELIRTLRSSPATISIATRMAGGCPNAIPAGQQRYDTRAILAASTRERVRNLIQVLRRLMRPREASRKKLETTTPATWT